MRSVLVLMQIIGALGILAYPGVLVATVMSLAASGGGLTGLLWRGVLVVALAYPVLWVALFWMSWQAFHRGSPGLALALSAPPLAVSVAAVILVGVNTGRAISILRGYAAGEARDAERVKGESPLAGSLLLFERGKLSWPQLQEAVKAADAAELSRPVERHLVDVPGVKVERVSGGPPGRLRPCTPLAIALEGSALYRTFETRQGDSLVNAARALLARGARLSADEQSDAPTLVWLADTISKGIALPDISAATENPLVWTIMTSARSDEPRVAAAIYAAGHRDPELLRKPTTTYGTPLRAALLRGMSNRVRDLIGNGALLSDTERGIPSLAKQLDRFLALPVNAGCRETYEANLGKRPGTEPAVR